jgi:hypothetical protein
MTEFAVARLSTDELVECLWHGDSLQEAREFCKAQAEDGRPVGELLYVLKLIDTYKIVKDIIKVD